jgi:hypothetical protein
MWALIYSIVDHIILSCSIASHDAAWHIALHYITLHYIILYCVLFYMAASGEMLFRACVATASTTTNEEWLAGWLATAWRPGRLRCQSHGWYLLRQLAICWRGRLIVCMCVRMYVRMDVCMMVWVSGGAGGQGC